MPDDAIRAEINKRFTLNWLIQGAAQHAGMTFHYLVRDELNAIEPRLLRFYDQYALINLLQYWRLEAALLFGWPPLFWRRAKAGGRHAFGRHSLLSKYGGMLAAAGKRRAVERCREKGLTRLPFLFSFQLLFVTARLRMLESGHQWELVQLAKQSTSKIWGIPVSRLDGMFGKDLRFASTIKIHSIRGAIMRGAICGLGVVVHNGNTLMVVGRGTNWQLLTKELVKGTAELICLHGLNDLTDDTYREVMNAADRLDYEPWMLQTGGELWRRLLALLPDGQRPADALMYLARLPAADLEQSSEPSSKILMKGSDC